MIGGLIKSNRVAALAGAGFVAGALAVSPAQAADLGGDCCADLEERVATLEATTARKGNRKVSLTISGWVNTGIYVWDDGVDSDAFVVTDNGSTLATRITFSGAAKINSDWSAGYTITIEPQNSETLLGVTQNDDDAGVVNGVGILESYMYVKSEQLGKLSWGLQSQATDNVGIVDLSGSIFSSIPVVFRGNNFRLRNSTTGGFFDAAGNAIATNGATTARANVGSLLQCQAIGGAGIGNDCNGFITNNIKYESPTVSGFTLSASWGEDDFYDVALKYAGQFGDFKVAGAAGYTAVRSDSDGTGPGPVGNNTDVDVFTLAGSIMHVPTGIFVNVTYTAEDIDTVNGVNPGVTVDDPDSIYIKAGIKQKWNSLGATAIYGEWAQYNDQFGSIAGVTGSEVTRYGVGIHQWIDAASMQLYARWNTLEFDVDGTSDLAVDGIEDFTTFTFGGVIFF